MTYASILAALADPTRLEVAERLVSGPRSVGEIAQGLRVSRPAVSQHLKALSEAGVVTVTPSGTRRIYALRPEALGELRAYVEGLWRRSLEAFAEHVAEEGGGAMTEEITELPVPPVVVTVTVGCSPAEAFRRFTRDFGRWWPIASHAVGKAVACAMEPFVGGQIHETTEGGETHLWGRISIWEPGRRLAFTWHPGRPPSAGQMVEVTFQAEGEGCVVRLEHRGWAVDERERRDSYDQGWRQVLGDHFAGYRP